MATIPFMLLSQLIPYKAKEAGLHISWDEMISMQRVETELGKDCFQLRRSDELINITAWQDSQKVIQIRFVVSKIPKILIV